MHWMDLARKDIGTKEISGSRHNPKVLAYYRDAGFPEISDDETAWCAAFVGAVLHRSGLPSSDSLMARSYLNYGEKLQAPRQGAIVVFSRGGSSWQGHVGFVERWDSKYIYCLGGNQSNGVSVAAFPRSKVLGYRMPPDVYAGNKKLLAKVIELMKIWG